MALDASRRNHPVPRLALWSLGAGIVATVGANLAHGLGHGPVGALVSAWPALALVGSFELLMLLIRKHHQAAANPEANAAPSVVAPGLAQLEPSVVHPAPTLEQTVRGSTVPFSEIRASAFMGRMHPLADAAETGPPVAARPRAATSRPPASRSKI